MVAPQRGANTGSVRRRKKKKTLEVHFTREVMMGVNEGSSGDSGLQRDHTADASGK